MCSLIYPYESPVRDAIVWLKFHNKRYLAANLADLAEQTLPDDLHVEALVPMTLGSARESERGFNQSRLITTALGWRLGLPLVDDLLTRKRDTASQTSLVRAERWRNVQGAFSSVRNVSRATILLVGDVATTGATLDDAARALRCRGGR